MKRNKDDFVDDGRVIASMEDVNHPFEKIKIKKEKRLANYNLSKEEKRGLILASYKAYFPVLLCGLIGMGIAILIVYLWLS